MSPCSRGVREPAGIARCGVKTWRQGARWHRQMWRQNVASRAHVASGSPVASPNIWRPNVASRAPRRQGARWRRQTWRQNVASLAHAASGSQVASPDLASKRGVIDPGGVRQPGGVAGAVPGFTPIASPGVTGRGVRTWRRSLTWHQRATWRPRTWHQNTASGAIDLRGLTGRSINTWRQEAQASRQVSSKRVFNRRAICAPPTGDPPQYNMI